jgi:hypothetical protein
MKATGEEQIASVRETRGFEAQNGGISNNLSEKFRIWLFEGVKEQYSKP